jgi:hypothetical protein
VQRVTCADSQAVAVTLLTTACCFFVSVRADDSAGGVRYGISVSVSCDRPDAPQLEARKFVRAHIEYVETCGHPSPPQAEVTIAITPHGLMLVSLGEGSYVVGAGEGGGGHEYYMYVAMHSKMPLQEGCCAQPSPWCVCNQ